MGKSWCVVEFEDGVQIVPQIWIDGDKCYWPPQIESQKWFNRAVREYLAPDDSWTLHGVRIFGVYDSYELAVPKLKLAEFQSDLNTDDEKKSRASRKRILPSSDEDDDMTDEDASLKAFPKFPKGKESYSTPETMISAVSTPKSTKPVFTPRSCSSANSSKLLNDTLNARSLTPTVKQPLTDCCICCCKFDKDYKKKIENDLNEVKNQLELVLQILREQCRPAIVNENKENFADFEERLPMKSEEDVHIWEMHLRNKDEQKKLISFLAHIGGHEVNTIVKNILRKLLTDTVASSYNWEGKKGKKMFSSLIVSDCIRKAAVLSPNSKGTTEQDIITSVKNWLRHATARLNNNNQKKSAE